MKKPPQAANKRAKFFPRRTGVIRALTRPSFQLGEPHSDPKHRNLALMFRPLTQSYGPCEISYILRDRTNKCEGGVTAVCVQAGSDGATVLLCVNRFINKQYCAYSKVFKVFTAHTCIRIVLKTAEWDGMGVTFSPCHIRWAGTGSRVLCETPGSPA